MKRSKATWPVRVISSVDQVSDDFEMVAPIGLSIFCFDMSPGNFERIASGDRAFNERRSLPATRRQFVSLDTTLGGRFALRGVSELSDNFARQPILLEDLRRVARSLVIPASRRSE